MSCVPAVPCISGSGGAPAAVGSGPGSTNSATRFTGSGGVAVPCISGSSGTGDPGGAGGAGREEKEESGDVKFGGLSVGMGGAESVAGSGPGPGRIVGLEWCGKG